MTFKGGIKGVMLMSIPYLGTSIGLSNVCLVK